MYEDQNIVADDDPAVSVLDQGNTQSAQHVADYYLCQYFELREYRERQVCLQGAKRADMLDAASKEVATKYSYWSCASSH